MDKIKSVFSKDSSHSDHSSADHNPTSNTGIRSTAQDTGLGSKGAETTTTRGNAGGIASQGHELGAGGIGGHVLHAGGQNTTGSEIGSGGVHHHQSGSGHHEILDKVSHRHERDVVPSEGETTTSDHKHLAAVTKEKVHQHEIEEISRVREHEKHHHHVQHHVQPLIDTQHQSAVHSERVVPTAHIKERHVNTTEDQKNYEGLNVHRDERIKGEKERTVVDKGETITESHHHHVHHVVQPVIQRDIHQHNVIHTTIPTHHITHEAPIVHQSTQHQAMNIKDFISGGGDLKSKLTHSQAGVLVDGKCERDIDEPLSDLSLTRTSPGTTTPSGGSSNIPSNFGGNRNTLNSDRRGSNSGIVDGHSGNVGGAGSGQRGTLA